MSARKLVIRCKGADVAEIEKLVPLQGNFKTLENAKARKLRKALISDGFCFPFLVWKNSDKLFILDGHQRDKVILGLKREGFQIPPLPIVYVDAADEREAKRKILLLSSQYGDITHDGLMEFLESAHITLDDIVDTVDLPTINIDKLLSAVDSDDLLEETNHEDERKFQIIVDCADEQAQMRLIEKLEKQGHTCRALIL